MGKDCINILCNFSYHFGLVGSLCFVGMVVRCPIENSVRIEYIGHFITYYNLHKGRRIQASVFLLKICVFAVSLFQHQVLKYQEYLQ